MSHLWRETCIPNTNPTEISASPCQICIHRCTRPQSAWSLGLSQVNCDPLTEFHKSRNDLKIPSNRRTEVSVWICDLHAHMVCIACSIMFDCRSSIYTRQIVKWHLPVTRKLRCSPQVCSSFLQNMLHFGTHLQTWEKNRMYVLQCLASPKQTANG